MSGVVEWTAHESALWWTCTFLRDLRFSDRLPASIAVPFAMQAGADEFVFQAGSYERAWFGAAGDGSYQRSWLVAGGFSPLGLGLGALTAGGSAALNASRKARARQDASLMWRPLDSGTVFVSTHAYYLRNSYGPLAFTYADVVAAEIVQPGAVQVSVAVADGSQQSFALSTHWAELIFVCWAVKRCPGHPQLHNLAWLPREFIDRIRYAGAWEASPLPELAAG